MVMGPRLMSAPHKLEIQELCETRHNICAIALALKFHGANAIGPQR
jgi:hypothetical protein